MDPSDVGASATISATVVRAIVSAMRAKGCDPAPLLTKVGIEEAALADVRGRVPAIATARLWNEAPAVVGDHDLGLSLGMGMSEAFALAAYLLRASPTLGEGLERLYPYYRVFNDVHPLVMTQPDDLSVCLAMQTKHSPLPAPRHAVEFAFSWFVNVVRQTTAQDLVPTSIAFEHPRPASTTAHDAFFRCPIAFDQDLSEIRFPIAWLALPLPSSDPHLREILEIEAQAELARLPLRPAVPQDTKRARVRRIIDEMLPEVNKTGDEPTLETVAARLRMSARTLQRYLKDEGSTFQAELDGLRREIAERRLREGDASLVAIAYDLGFADQSAFHKAFVRWTGKTPGDFRRGG